MRTVSVMLVLLVSLVIAGPGNPSADPSFCTDVTYPTWTDVSGTPDCETGEQGTARPAVTGDIDQLLVSGTPGQGRLEDEPTIKVRPFMDWGDDKLIVELNSTPVFGKVCTDVAPNGDIYLGVLDPNTGSTNDTIFFFRSPDGGATWTYLNYIAGPSGDIRDFELRVGSDAGGTWWYAFVVYDGSGGLYVRRLRANLGSLHWTQIVGGDTIQRVTADRNVETPQHLFCAWENASGNVKMESSSDSAQTWGNQRNVVNNSHHVAVCAGAAGYMYITFLDRADSAYIRVGRYTNNLVSPTFIYNSVDSSATHTFRDISIAAARTTPGGSQRAIILSTYRNTSGNIGPRYAWTTNGGTAWNASYWPPTNQARATWDARHPYIRCSYGETGIFRGIVTMHEPTASWDTLVYAFSRATTPTTWEARADHNDFRITGEFGGQVDYSDETNGAYIVYREYAGKKIWFDGYNWTGVEEGRPAAPAANAVRTTFAGSVVRLNLNHRAGVTARLYDGAGRVVQQVFDGTLDAGEHQLPVAVGTLAHGVYFINVDIDGDTRTGKLILTD